VVWNQHLRGGLQVLILKELGERLRERGCGWTGAAAHRIARIWSEVVKDEGEGGRVGRGRESTAQWGVERRRHKTCYHKSTQQSRIIF
jgi:hypothetical protein